MDTAQPGLHDKFQIARIVNGFPSIVVIGLSYPSAPPSADELKHRLTLLQQRFPSLCAVFDYNEDSSKRQWRRGEPHGADELVRETSSESSLEELLRREMDDLLEPVKHAPTLLLERPLFRVSRHPRALTLITSHLLCDGSGAFHLLNALLMGEDELIRLPDESEKPFALPVFEDTLPPQAMTPTAQPAQLAATPNIPWPGSVYANHPSKCAPGFCTLHIPSQTLQQIKLEGRQHDISTLGPILHTSLAAAMFSVFSADGAWNFASSTALNDRGSSSESPFFPYMTGNYFNGCTFEASLQGSEPLWELVARYRDVIRDPSEKAKTTARMSMARKMPDLDGFFAAGLTREAPYTHSLLFTNMAYQTLPEGASDMAWSQEPSPASGALIVCLVGCDKGTNATFCFRDGGVVTAEQVESLVETWHRVLQRIAQGFDGTLAALVDHSESG